MFEAKTKAGNIAIAVGSPQNRICSIGSFARSEAAALKAQGQNIVYLEATGPQGEHFLETIPNDVDVINLHIPSLHDRKRPWNVLATAIRIRTLRPNVKLVTTLHELSEAPLHWRLRAKLVGYLSHGIVVNSDADFALAKHWGRKLVKISLGPTLWNEDLLKNPQAPSLRTYRAAALERLRLRFQDSIGFDFRTPWVLHAGLLTGGKGLEQLQQWCAKNLAKNPTPVQFVLAGGFGPKIRDQSFAQEMTDGFRSALKTRFGFIPEPSDSEYADLLVATDLLILPYDAGVSERRSSFLAACASGANIWTTTSQLSKALQLESSGVFQSPAQDVDKNIQSLDIAVNQAISKQFEDENFNRRLQNLKWAQARTWPVRVRRFLDFVKELS